MSVKTLTEVRSHKILAYVTEDGTCPVEDFLEAMPERDRKKMVARIQFTADHGPSRNREQNKPVEGTKFFELKTPGQRVFWRWSRNNEVILMHGFVKRQERIPQGELQIGHATYTAIEDEMGAANE